MGDGAGPPRGVDADADVEDVEIGTGEAVEVDMMGEKMRMRVEGKGSHDRSWSVELID